MPRAEALRRRAGREVALGLIRERRDQPVEQRDVDALNLAGAMASEQREQNPLIGVEARDDVRDRCADLDGLPIRLAGEIDDPRFTLRDDVVAGTIAVRSGLAVAGNRRVDEARI